jgi:hypothetical protein
VSEFLTLQQTADLAGVKAEQIRVRILLLHFTAMFSGDALSRA